MEKTKKLKTEFTFDAAHRLVGYNGLCSNLHGHIWKVRIEVEGNKLDDVGILWDFTNVKLIKKQFDHKTILKNCDDNNKLIKVLYDIGEIDSVYLMKENPTAENLCEEILNMLKEDGLTFKVTVWESPKSYCEVKG